jgi:sterol desaturase/sphingolipid hydroxylase (fatty acid hydroxylase superfamily)
MLFIWYLTSFWAMGLLFAFIDLGLAPHCLRIRDHWIQPVSRANMKHLYRKCIPVVIRNQLVIQLPFLILLERFHEDREMNIWWDIINSGFQHLLTAIVFTITHWLFHRYCYWIHKTHHVFIRPIAISTEYNSLSEEAINWGYTYIIAGLIPVSHPWLIINIVILNVIDQLGHCGYDLWTMTDYHDSHHRLFNVNLSPLPGFDKWNGTFLIRE